MTANHDQAGKKSLLSTVFAGIDIASNPGAVDPRVDANDGEVGGTPTAHDTEILGPGPVGSPAGVEA